MGPAPTAPARPLARRTTPCFGDVVRARTRGSHACRSGHAAARSALAAQAVRGLPFQYTAMMLPVMAIQTTLTAAGTRTSKAPKCREASR